ncbi:FAD-dependent oxidoreductase [Salinisphaera sp.]|uniref:NAD(P)/FAD-dependent oxidoreductase n=1 Tax=Salinisphaera sp. TaxID=1914330 RepID=UPI000C3DC27B|nr:FAD-dependent oxidoreductase [Salinisphaera sp.]MBS63730.1 hypothetical protein [Salinisphaera sp.]
MSEPNQEIIIVGGGAGGAELAVRLARAGCGPLRLIDQAASHVWKPRLHELAAGASKGELGEIPYQDIAERWGFVFEQGALADIDAEAKTICLDDDSTHDYRLLVLAVGGVTPDLGVEGVKEHAVMLDRYPDAPALYQRFTAALDKAAAQPPRPARVAIVGSGLTGVELAGYLASNPEVVASPDSGLPQTLEIHLIEASSTFMPVIDDDRTREDVRSRLADLGIRIHTGQKIAQVQADGVKTESGDRFDADMTVWAAGRVGPPLASRIDALATNDAQQWLIRDTLQSRDYDDIFAIGDCSACPQAEWPATAQVASQQAEHLSEQITAYLDGRAPTAFSFGDKGMLMSFGNGGDLGLVVGPTNDYVRISGHVSHAAYRGLQRQHQWVLLGTKTTLEGAVGDVVDALS